MSDSKTRPRLVSVDGEAGEAEPDAPNGPVAAEAPAPERRGGARWLLVVLLVAAIGAVVVLGTRIQTLQGQNDALAGELSSARAALAAYANRFAEVRSSVEGLQAQLEQLGVLVSADPLEAAPAAPTAEAAESPAPAD